MKVLVELETEDIARIRESLEAERDGLNQRMNKGTNKIDIDMNNFRKFCIMELNAILEKLTF